MKRIYLDHAAGTPVDPGVLAAMQPYFSERYGNPGSLHSFGQEAIAAIDGARETIARALGAEFREVIFTSSATEANNLALRGAVAAFRRANPALVPCVVVSSLEHESILETARSLEREGAKVNYLPADAHGTVSLKDIKKLLDGRTAIISVMYAQNETGKIQPVAEIGQIIKEFRGAATAARTFPLFHTDAAQTLQFMACNVNELNLDLMTISSHKIYGPKGAGALYVRASQDFPAEITGGGQEFGVRSGTENVPAIVGFAKAVEMLGSSEQRENEKKKMASLIDTLWSGIKKIYPEAELNGGISGTHLPNILNVYFHGYRAEELLTIWDLHGLAASSGSACRSRAAGTSYVIEAMGYSKERARASIRLSLGRPTTDKDIHDALDVLKSTFFAPASYNKHRTITGNP